MTVPAPASNALLQFSARQTGLIGPMSGGYDSAEAAALTLVSLRTYMICITINVCITTLHGSAVAGLELSATVRKLHV